MSFIDFLFGPSPEPVPEPLPIYDAETAIRYVRTLGYTVIKTRMPSNPGLGTCWSPRKRLAGGSGRSEGSDRWVRSVGADAMSYATERAGLPVQIKLTTWHEWVRKTRAVEQRAAADPARAAEPK